MATTVAVESDSITSELSLVVQCVPTPNGIQRFLKIPNLAAVDDGCLLTPIIVNTFGNNGKFKDAATLLDEIIKA